MRLRKFKGADVGGILGWMHDDRVNCFFEKDFASFTERDVLKFIDSTKDETVDFHRACVDENDCYLGTVSLKNIDIVSKKAEYAVCFSKESHGTGAAAFATKEILRIGFCELGLNRIYLNVIAENEQANRFYKKMGFVFEGTFQEHAVIHKRLCDLNWYRLLKREWEQQNA